LGDLVSPQDLHLINSSQLVEMILLSQLSRGGSKREREKCFKLISDKRIKKNREQSILQVNGGNSREGGKREME
jgi:ABC-type lipoprotein export system ATPase subunit